MLTWTDVIGEEKGKPYFLDIMDTINTERAQGQVVYPKNKDIFNAFRYTNFYQVKVVILGQDPYHQPNQAHGLSFSVLPGVAIPPSLLNIYKELANDIDGFSIPNHGCLINWAKQGVFLLNNTLTVRANLPQSHLQLGWEQFTDIVVSKLNEYRENLAFLLWGKSAQIKGKYIDTNKHLVLKTVHPSPLSAYRGFFGCKHFSKTNRYLLEHNITPINWQL